MARKTNTIWILALLGVIVFLTISGPPELFGATPAQIKEDVNAVHITNIRSHPTQGYVCDVEYVSVFGTYKETVDGCRIDEQVAASDELNINIHSAKYGTLRYTLDFYKDDNNNLYPKYAMKDFFDFRFVPGDRVTSFDRGQRIFGDIIENIKVEPVSDTQTLCLQSKDNKLFTCFANWDMAPGKMAFDSSLPSYTDPWFPGAVIRPTNTLMREDSEFREEIPDKLMVRFDCPLPSGYLLASETFDGGSSVSKMSFRYPVSFFCNQHPVLITDSTEQNTYVDPTIYQDLVDGEVINIPQDQTMTFYYAMKVVDELEVVCEEGSYDVDAGECTKIESGFTHVCSEGTFDPIKGMCVIQPTGVCEVGYYDTQLEECVWNPPIQADCEKGIYYPDSGKCKWTPPEAADCSAYPGSTYNPITEKCEKDGVTIVCSSGGTYNPQTQKCERIVQSEVICSDVGGQYDPVSQTCYTEVDTEHRCTLPGGIYDPDSDRCYTTADTRWLCEDGTLVWEGDTPHCSINPTVLCERGEWNPESKQCEYSMEMGECELGEYVPERNVCVVYPETDRICEEGVWSDEADACIAQGKVKYTCKVGTYNEESGFCEIIPQIATPFDLEFAAIVVLFIGILFVFLRKKRR